jgi:2-isopropylmalate synthase
VVQPNKAVVGANAFAHASGIHQDGVLKARDTYEIMRAEDVGWTTNRIVLGKLSGRNAFKQRLKDLGIEMESEAEVNAAFLKFKELADRKSDIFDEDILALVMDESVTAENEHYRLVSLSQRSEMGSRPQASVSFAAGEVDHFASSDGNGPVDASLKAIESRVGKWRRIAPVFGQCHHLGSTESQGEVTVRLQRGGRIVNGMRCRPGPSWSRRPRRTSRR